MGAGHHQPVTKPWPAAPPAGRRCQGVDSFEGKFAVVTGGGSGMGRELVRQLAAQGCSVATCDLNADSAAATADLVFSNAGVGGAGSFVKDSRQDWERTFAIDWWGVYYCARAFLPLLIASRDGVLVNTSSVNGFWATLGPGMPNTAYATAKFAVKGFTEALIEDLRVNAPHVRVAVVMPGHVGTDIIANTLRAHGLPEPERMTDAQVTELIPAALAPEGATPEELRQMLVQVNAGFRDNAPLSAADAAAVILDGVRSGAWRILVGEDAKTLDAAVRAKPEAAYDYTQLGSTWAPGTPER